MNHCGSPRPSRHGIPEDKNTHTYHYGVLDPLVALQGLHILESIRCPVGVPTLRKIPKRQQAAERGRGGGVVYSIGEMYSISCMAVVV